MATNRDIALAYWRSADTKLNFRSIDRATKLRVRRLQHPQLSGAFGDLGSMRSRNSERSCPTCAGTSILYQAISSANSAATCSRMRPADRVPSLTGPQRLATVPKGSARKRTAVANGYARRMANHKRRGEVPEPHSRCDRVILARGRWYVATRECIDVGPYDSKEAADFVAAQLAIALDGVDDPQIVLSFISDFQRLP